MSDVIKVEFKIVSGETIQLGARPAHNGIMQGFIIKITPTDEEIAKKGLTNAIALAWSETVAAALFANVERILWKDVIDLKQDPIKYLIEGYYESTNVTSNARVLKYKKAHWVRRDIDIEMEIDEHGRINVTNDGGPATVNGEVNPAQFSNPDLVLGMAVRDNDDPDNVYIGTHENR